MAQLVWEIDLSQCSDGLFHEWLEAEMAACLDSEDARVVLLSWSGEAPAPEAIPPGFLRYLTLFELPVIVAFEGALFGPLTELALAADVRICSEGASLQGRLSGNARIRSLTDESTALALFLGRTAVPAPELLRAGLVSIVTPRGGALAVARRVAGVIASRGPIATRFAKEAIWRGLGQPLEQALRFETDLTLLLQTTKDRAEGVRAFMEKRPPIFTGD